MDTKKKKAWRLIFAEGLLSHYLHGGPVWSFRRYSPGSHEFKKGQIIEGHFKDGLTVLLEVDHDTVIKPFSAITPKESRDWGNCSRSEMMRQLRNYYPGLKRSDTAALIMVRLARIKGRPVVGPLPKEV